MKKIVCRPCRHPGCPALVRERGHAYCDKHAAAVKRPCRTPGCPNVIGLESRFCSTCEAAYRENYDQERGSARERGYDSTWEKVRLAFLHAHPICARCERAGKIAPAVLVHHIRPISEGGARLDPENLEALCRACHDLIHHRRKPR